jgi:DNA-directed RNA polymerases I, II, and III subunit RPABC2
MDPTQEYDEVEVEEDIEEQDDLDDVDDVGGVPDVDIQQTEGGLDEEEDDEDDEDDDEDDEFDNAQGGSDEEDNEDNTDNEEEESEFVPRNVNDMEYIKTYHPEAIPISFDTMYERSIITRNKEGIIVDPLHKTLPILSKYEKTKIIGLRVNQLNKGAQPFISGQQSIIDNHIIANQELIEKKIPFIIKRPLPNGKSEFWFVKDLELI